MLLVRQDLDGIQNFINCLKQLK